MTIPPNNSRSRSIKAFASALLLLTLTASSAAAQQSNPPPAAVAALAKPLATYRLSFTLTEMDGGKKIGVQHFTMVSDEKGSSELRVGSKVPVASGPPAESGSPMYTYVDVSLNIDARVEEVQEGLRVYTRVAQSSIGPPPNDRIYQPVVRNTSLSTNAVVAPGKPTLLGSFDIPGSTRHSEVEVVLEPVH